ncbi:19022_t:CDS:2 [Entrophospora sp. SA101]|nr:19022_t:CDS:2 [Entrophospora sp. SA101]
MTEEKSKAEVQMLQAVQHATIATVMTEQVQQYARSTMTSIRKNFLDDSERRAKRTRFCKDSNDGDGTKDNPFFVSNEESSNDENDGDLFFHPSSSSSLSDAPDLFSSEIISDVHNGISSDKNNQASLPSTQVSHDLVRTEHPLQTLQCILKSEENFTNIWNKYLLKIDLHPWRVEYDCIVENDEESLLQNELASKRSVISHPSTTEAMWSTIMSFVTGKAIRLDTNKILIDCPLQCEQDSNDGDSTKDNLFFVPNEESSNDENDSEIVLFFHSTPLGGISDAPDLFSSEIISDVQNGISSDKNDQTSLPSMQVSHDPVITEHPLQALQCILKSEENFTNIWNKYLLKIDLHPWRVEHDCQQLCPAEESLLRRLKPILQMAKNDKESLLQKFAQVWIDIGKGGITLFEQYALLVIHIFVSELTSKRNVISHSLTTEAMWSTIMSFVTEKAVFTMGHKGDGAGLSNDGHECFVLEISYEDFYKLLQEMRDMVASANEVWNCLESQYETITTLESSDDGDNFTKVSPMKPSRCIDMNITQKFH